MGESDNDAPPKGSLADLAQQAGYDPLNYSPGRAENALHIMALILPDTAHVFQRVVLDGDDEHTVALELGFTDENKEKNVQRELRGHVVSRAHGKSHRVHGALDWFLVFLELFREADLVEDDGSMTLGQGFSLTQREEEELPAFHQSLGLAALRSLCGATIDEILDYLPWRPIKKGEPTVGWPIYGDPCPLPRCGLPQLMRTMRGLHPDARFWMCFLLGQLAADEPEKAYPKRPDAWTILMRALRSDAQAAAAQIGPHLATWPRYTRVAALGVLAGTQLPWAELVKSAGVTLPSRALTQEQRIIACSKLYLDALGDPKLRIRMN